MEFTLLNELALLLRAKELRGVDLVRLEEVRRLEAALPRRSTRAALAGALVALGLRLDGSAGERLLATNAARTGR
ncbi:MAG: hypothetical protein IVW36_08570 [Dehalococcoidia bacterium]|nr:hypothetical protein [Dehalococcoidia bacterium]